MKKIILICCTIFCFFSCENNTEIDNPIQGKWNVMQIIGGLSPTKEYNEGEFTWFFDFDEKTISIVNNVDIFNHLDLPSFTNNQGGIYSFHIITENNITYLKVGERKGTISLINNELKIDFGIAFDDIAYIFKR